MILSSSTLELLSSDMSIVSKILLFEDDAWEFYTVAGP